MKNFVVAIDGPAGSGKSSISKMICERLPFTHIDTGAMYRAVTLEALRRKIDVEDETQYSFVNDIEVVYKDGKVYLNGDDVSGLIRTTEVTNNASAVARVKIVREKMVDFQRGCRNYGNILMDGRDIGTVVFPDANLKIFLTATPEERALRRYKENKAAGMDVNYDTLLEEIKIRDFKDSTRKIAPLKQAEDAILIDTTNMTMDEVTNTIIEKINERLK
ncbi:MAG: (d)CMP kinase [Acholeplasmatales bacterium]|nr:(d)CMP kinase [Acholeplasmatales bacterium]